jgi:nitrogen fixation protein NifX
MVNGGVYMSYRIAVASTDGKVVNQHFGRTEQFYIIEVNEDETYKSIEIRKLPPSCLGANHDDDTMQGNVESLSDCKYVLVSRIGQGAENVLDRQGITSYVIPGLIEESVNKLISYVQINKLIDDALKN